jgi:diguanylate cyclase (GGDEF)-like protein
MQFGALRNGLKAAFRTTNVVGGIALLVVIGSAVFADMQNRALQEQQLRSSIDRQVGVLRARLEGNINGNMQLVHGLVATLVTEPDMTQDKFAIIASRLFDQHSQLKDIAGAPNLKVSLLYPVEGNEKLLGLDYNTLDAQSTAIFRARDRQGLILAGPVSLLQGGRGFVGRFPVFVPDKAGGKDRFWGVVSAVVDADKLYRDSGLLDADMRLDIALRGVDGTGANGQVFFGDERALADRPVTADVMLPTGYWQVAARPHGGWEAALPDPLPFRLGLALAALFVLVPLFVARRLIEQRQRHIKVLAERESQLDILSRRLSLALDTSQVGVWEHNVDIDCLVWDDRMNELYGSPRDGGARNYRHWRAGVHPDDVARAEQEFSDAVRNRGRYISEYRLRLADGTERAIRAIGNGYRHNDGSWRIVGVNWDVSDDIAIRQDLQNAKALTEARNAELVAATARIEHTSLHDALTELPNRRYLDKVLAERAAAARGEDGVALLHIDLDRFKQINDTLGHAAGDAMLVHVAKVLRDNVRADDFVARIGGDEFVVVSPLRNGRRDLTRLANRIIEEMRTPIPYQGHECRCGVSVGIAYQRGSVDDKRLLIDADIALYRAKRRGRNRLEFFTEALQAEIVSNKQMADDILAGIEQGQFIAWYQPQFDARTHHISGVEALARWEHPTRGIVAPDLFLPIAEELNVVATIDRMILEQTLAWMKLWRAQGLIVPHASVNVSGRRLRDDTLIKSLKKLDIEPGTISFELVESIYLDESDDMVSWNIEQIRELGIDIEMDDFGTGYASIVSLMKLRPTRLKIDRQLVLPVVESESQRQLIASIVDIGHSLGIAVVAEGVETLEHGRIAADLGCDILQGYAFAKPLSPNAIERFIAKRQEAAA